MSQKGFTAPVLLVLVLLVAFGLAFYSLHQPNKSPVETPQQTPQPTQLPSIEKKFRILTDSQDGFSFRYPYDLSVVDDGEKTYDDRNGGIDYAKNFTNTYRYTPPTLIKGFLVKSDDLKDLNMAPFTVWVFDNPDNLSVARWYKNYWYYPFVWGEYEPQKSLEGPTNESSVSGEPSYFRTLNYRPQTPKFIYLPHNGKMYFFRVATPDKGREDIGTEILNSFKFSD